MVKTFLVSGADVHSRSAADWLETLESRTDRFGGVDLSAIDIKGDAKAVTYSFTIKFTYRPPAGS